MAAYTFHEPTNGIRYSERDAYAMRIPAGAVLIIGTDPIIDGMVNALWHGEKIGVFMRDVQAHAKQRFIGNHGNDALQTLDQQSTLYNH
jgi:hypothetical protein